MSLKLVDKIEAGHTDIHSLSANEKQALLKLVVNADYQHIIEKIVNPHVKVYNYNEYSPYWLESDFDEDIWHIRFKREKKPKVIDFNITLEDGELLTSAQHRPLLNNFKYWITSLDNPRLNGGTLSKPQTVQRKIAQAVLLINAMLLKSKELGLAKHHLQAINRDAVMSIMVCYAKENGRDVGVYDYHNRLSQFLKRVSKIVTDAELAEFENKFPYINRNILQDEKALSLSDSERKKAICYLHRENYYRGNCSNIPHPLSSKFAQQFYQNKVIWLSELKFKHLPELFIKPQNINTEYPAVPCKADSETRTDESVSRILSIFKVLASTKGKKDCSNIDVSAFKNVSIKSIMNHVDLNHQGRFATLPPTLVFKSIKHAFEFVFEKMDDILSSMFAVLESQPVECYVSGFHKWKRTASGDIYTVLTEYKKSGFKVNITRHLKDLGVNTFYIADYESDRFNLRRANKGLVDLYNVLLGSIQFLVGATMARRRGELLGLKSFDNLRPLFIDPNLNRKKEFFLIFDAQKTGVGGEYSQRDKLEKPVLNSVAGIIYKLEVFNKKLIEKGLASKSKLGLFNSIGVYDLKASKFTANNYYHSLEAFCDYFELDTVTYDEGEERRYYIRPHQLRRFFAMVFFWSKGFDGLDTLRHFLGHTDVEHLYHYVTEGVAGQVLNGIKVKALVDKVTQQKIDNIARLKELMKERFNAEMVEISSLSDAVEDYEDASTTEPQISTLKEQLAQEKMVLELLDNQVIDLQPEFFTVMNDDGSRRRDFNLVLRIIED